LPIATDRFQGHADHYARFRPDYPERLLRSLARSIRHEPPPPGGLVVDVGSGTGIFTRQLRAVLPAGTPMLGIEPASDMRLKAGSDVMEGIAYRDGTAEELPFDIASARAVVAATAAHWFDRPAFLAEAHRVLLPRGILAIVEYVRDETSPAAAVVEEFLRRHGGPRVYARPDYITELHRAAGFRDVAHEIEPVVLKLPPEALVGLALSSSHARAVIDALGRQTAEETLLRSVEHLVSEDGSIPFGYRFHLFTARRAETTR
jgi:SAM-dependent methyltransferase